MRTTAVSRTTRKLCASQRAITHRKRGALTSVIEDDAIKNDPAHSFQQQNHITRPCAAAITSHGRAQQPSHHTAARTSDHITRPRAAAITSHGRAQQRSHHTAARSIDHITQPRTPAMSTGRSETGSSKRAMANHTAATIGTPGTRLT